MRAGLFVAILWLIRDQHRSFVAALARQQPAGLALDRLRPYFPAAHALAEWDSDRGGWTVVDASGDTLGYVVQTSPASDRIIGYSGPTNALITFSPEHTIRGVCVLQSGDTPEHVAAVTADGRFLNSFRGLTWEAAAARRNIDAVSGATLTSLAIAEGIIARLGGGRPSLRFPEPIQLEEVREFLPAAMQLSEETGRPGVFAAVDAAGRRVGWALRTSPAGDDLIGYQGPTDTLIVCDAEGRVAGLAVRNSYETPEYLGYVTDDADFMKFFNGKNLEELAGMDLREAGVEGVSGATMTSRAIAESLVRRASEWTQRRPAGDRGASPPGRTFRTRDIGTAAVIAAALVIGFTRLRGSALVRVAFQILLIAYLGLINGDLLSQEVLVGWAQHGLPWRLSPGMVLLAAAALAVPLTTRKQPYCHHLCPHGAAQQLLKNAVPWKLHLGRRTAAVLQMIPMLLLLGVLLTAMLHWPVNLAAIEPFDAYVWRVAGWGTIAVALIGLIAALFIPMAYCRFGCPTGAVLNYLRLHARSDEFTRRDAFALVCAALAAGLRLWA